MDSCIFCNLPPSRIAWSSPLVVAAWDGFLVSTGHALIVPRRHAGSWDDLTADDKHAILAGVDAIRSIIRDQHTPDAFNVGFNDGPAAGQTVMHFHVHVIPRYEGDVSDPRGGVRCVIGDKAAYWTDLAE
jgi:diadenosine tetraphosphate (Ap4A) HIT family hydrolase